MSKRFVLVVEVLLGILILGATFTELTSPNDPRLVISILVLVVIFFGILRRLSEMP